MRCSGTGYISALLVKIWGVWVVAALGALEVTSAIATKKVWILASVLAVLWR